MRIYGFDVAILGDTDESIMLCSWSTDVLSTLEAFGPKRYTNLHFTLH